MVVRRLSVLRLWLVRTRQGGGMQVAQNINLGVTWEVAGFVPEEKLVVRHNTEPSFVDNKMTTVTRIFFPGRISLSDLAGLEGRSETAGAA